MTDKDIRRAILVVMNERRKTGRHELEIRMHVSQIESALHVTGYKLSDEQVMQSVNYLANAKLLKQIHESETIKIPPSRYGSSRGASSPPMKYTNYFYTLTNQAIDELEGETEYSRKPFVPFQNIQINANNAPVVIGSNNKVNNNVAVFDGLDNLQQILIESPKLSVEQRQDVASDIESLKQQLVKPNPDSSVIKSLWILIERAAALAGASSLALEVAKGVATFLGHPLH